MYEVLNCLDVDTDTLEERVCGAQGQRRRSTNRTSAGFACRERSTIFLAALGSGFYKGRYRETNDSSERDSRAHY